MDSLITQLEEAEKASIKLESTATEINGWTETARRLGQYLNDSMHEQPAFITGSPEHNLRTWPIQDDGRPFNEILQIFDKEVIRNGLNPASGGHLGYIPGGGLYMSALADYLADVTNKYAGVHYASPGAVQMENMLLEWVRDLIGYPITAAGNLASGGSIANLSAIVTARDAKGINSSTISKAVIYGSAHMHHCLNKAIRISGLNEAVQRNIPLDANYRMDAETLRQMVNHDKESGLIPFLIIGSAGTTDTGAIDPLNDLADIAESSGCWFHVDAAYGGFFIMLDEIKHKFKGLERSDSMVCDPHKGLFLPYGTGALLVRDGKKLMESHYYVANYMQDSFQSKDEMSPADLSPELTKHFRGLRMWMPLMVHGLTPFKACLREKLLLVRYFRQHLRQISAFEMGPDPDLSVTFYRLQTANPADADAANHMLAEAIRQDGRLFVSTSVIDSYVFLRLAVLSFRTHKFHIDLLLNLLRDLVIKVSKTYPLAKPQKITT